MHLGHPGTELLNCLGGWWYSCFEIFRTCPVLPLHPTSAGPLPAPAPSTPELISVWGAQVLPPGQVPRWAVPGSRCTPPQCPAA
jgi:hypothetical protein